MVLAQLPKQQKNVHERKRHGQHHKSSKHYTKTYWPYLPMLLVVGLGIVVNTLWSGSGVLGYSTDVSPISLLQATNNNRAKAGDHDVTLNGQLAAAAQAKADDMAKRNYWSHVTPDGKQPAEFVEQAGYAYTVTGENLAYGFNSSQAVINGWMNSQSHKENLLNPAYTDVGFGVAHAASFQGHKNETIVVAVYGEPGAVLSHTTGISAGAEPAQLPTKTISRIDVLTNGAFTMGGIVIISLALLMALAFLFKHSRMWRKRIIDGEQFIIKHPVLDTLVVAIVTVGFILTRNSGFIG